MCCFPAGVIQGGVKRGSVTHSINLRLITSAPVCETLTAILPCMVNTTINGLSKIEQVLLLINPKQCSHYPPSDYFMKK